MGLLGDSFDDPKTMAVMNLAAGLLGGGNFGQALGRGLAGYQDTMSNAKKAALLEEQVQWQRDEHARLKDEQKRKNEVESLIRQQFAPITGTQAIKGDALGPTTEKAQNIGQLPQVNYQQLAAMGVPMDRLKALAEAPNLGRSKVARTVKGVGPDGREYEYQVDEFGQKVGDGLAQYRAPIMQDLGGQVAALDAYNLKPIAQFGKSMTPDGQASNALGWANNAVSRDRLAFDKAGGSDAVNGPKPQFNAEAGGFIFAPSQANPQGGIVPLPGFQRPLNDVQAKAQLFGTRMQEADKILGELQKDGKVFSTPGANTPFIGGVVNSLNSEKGQMLDQAKRDFINAVLRRESGAAIADSEFDSANKQYFPQAGDSQKVIEQKARTRQIAIQGILAEVPKGTKPLDIAPAGNKPAAGAPMLGQVVDGYKYKGGNPADPKSWEKQ